MQKKDLVIAGIAFIVIETLLNSGIFVTYQSMTSYAAPKSDITKIEATLIRIEEKIDKLALMRN